MSEQTKFQWREDRRLTVEALSEMIARGLPSKVMIIRPESGGRVDARSRKAQFAFFAIPDGKWQFRTAEGEVELRAGEVMVSAPGAWQVEITGSRRTKLGFSIDHHFIYAQYTRHRNRERLAYRVDWTYSPLGLHQAGYHLLLALAALEGNRLAMPTAQLAALGVMIELRKHFEYTDSSKEEPSRAYATYRSIVRFLHENFNQPLTRDGVASQFKLHPNHISRLFREHNAEQNFKAYLTRLRMEHAAQLIRRNAFSVDEICSACGYADAVHFRKAFKQYHGRPPGQFG